MSEMELYKIPGKALVTTEEGIFLDGTNEKLVTNIYTINLFDKKNIKFFGYYNQNGTWVTDANCISSGYIPIKPNTLYKWISGNSSDYSKCYFDKDKKSLNIKNWNSEFTTPDGCKYVTVTTTANDIERAMLIEGNELPNNYIEYKYNQLNNVRAIPKSKLQGLTWNALGDSLTNGYGEESYHVHVAELLRIGKVNNYGISGTTIGGTNSDAFVNRFNQMSDEADIITILGGINDINGSLTLGKMSDRSNATFYGSLHLLIQGIMKKYLGKKIGFITFPQIAKWQPDDQKVISYLNAIIEVCEYYGLPCLDLYRKSGLCPNIITSQRNYMKDDTHYTTDGYKLYFRDKIANFLESL